MRIVSIFPYLFFSVLTVSSMAAENSKNTAAPTPAKAPKAEKAEVPNKDAVAPAEPEEDDEAAAEKKEADDTIKVARPVTSDPVQIYGWREKVKVAEMQDELVAKLDTGALTSSIHAENQQIFEKDGKKWVKFVVTDPREDGAKRYEMEAPLVRTVLIKEPGEESERRNVVRLSFQIGERKIKAEFSLNNRNNMICPVLLGRSTIRVLGWVDPSRTYLADDKIIR
jgi:hypothetical protein